MRNSLTLIKKLPAGFASVTCPGLSLDKNPQGKMESRQQQHTDTAHTRIDGKGQQRRCTEQKAQDCSSGSEQYANDQISQDNEGDLLQYKVVAALINATVR